MNDIDSLLSDLHHKNYAVQRHAIDVLSETHDPRALDALIVLLNDSDGEHYADAIEALGKTGNPQVLEPLLRELRKTKVGWDDFYIRVALAKAFGELGDPRAIPDLELLVSTDMQEFDAWGTGVGISIAEFARTAIKRIRRKAKRKKG